MAASRRHKSRRRVAALNFLSNISLDGTHRDTNCAIFNRRGLFNNDTEQELTCDGRKSDDILLEKSCVVSGEHDHHVEGGGGKVQPASPTNLTQTPYKLVGSSEVFDDNASTCEELGEEKVNFGSSKRYRFNRCDTSPCLSSSFGGDPQANSFCSGEKPVRKRRLFHTLSISEDSSHNNEQNEVLDILQTLSVQGTRTRQKSTSSSTSSIGSGPKPVVRIVAPQRNKSVHFSKERVVLLSSRKSPFAVYSTLPYSRGSSQSTALQAELDSLLHQSSGTQLPAVTKEEALLHLGLRAIEQVEDGQDISYSQLLVPSRAHTSKGPSSTTKDGTHLAVPETAPAQPGGGSNHPPVPLRSWSHDPNLQSFTGSMYTEVDSGSMDGMYDPNLLDDPELRSGKHRTLITFPSYMTSVIDYVRPSELKKDLNEQFSEKFQYVQLSLSKLRSLKRAMKKIAKKCDIDTWTVAQAYVFFEKIILKGLINKPNRKLCAAVCLMLSAKLNDVKGHDLTELREALVDNFKLNNKDLLAFEFAILVALEFGLHTPDIEIYAHYQRLLYSS